MIDSRDIPQKVWESDSFLDFVIDELTEAAGYERGFTSPLNLARWDLKAALKAGLDRHNRQVCAAAGVKQEHLDYVFGPQGR